jgi:hypothetical protein
MGLALKGIGALANGATNLLNTGAARTAVATGPLYAAAAGSLLTINGGNKQNSLGTSSSTTLASTPPVKTAVAETPPPAAPPASFDFARLNQQLNDNQRMMSDWAYSMQAQQDSFNKQSADSFNALEAQAAAEKEQLRQKTQYRSTSGGYFGSSRRTLVGG